MQLGLEASGLAGQGFFHLGQQVFAAIEEFDRVDQFVDELALGVRQRPGEGHDARVGDVHQGMIAYRLSVASDNPAMNRPQAHGVRGPRGARLHLRMAGRY